MVADSNDINQLFFIGTRSNGLIYENSKKILIRLYFDLLSILLQYINIIPA